MGADVSHADNMKLPPYSDDIDVLQGMQDGRSRRLQWEKRQKERDVERRKADLRGVPLSMRRRDENGVWTLIADDDEFDREMRRLGRQPNPAVLALPAPEGWSGQRAESQALALLASGALTAAAKPLALPAPADWAPVASSEEAHKKQSRVPLTPIDGGVKRSAGGGASNFKRRRL
jgi:hypothetical protein